MLNNKSMRIMLLTTLFFNTHAAIAAPSDPEGTSTSEASDSEGSASSLLNSSDNDSDDTASVHSEASDLGANYTLIDKKLTFTTDRFGFQEENFADDYDPIQEISVGEGQSLSIEGNIGDNYGDDYEAQKEHYTQILEENEDFKEAIELDEVKLTGIEEITGTGNVVFTGNNVVNCWLGNEDEYLESIETQGDTIFIKAIYAKHLTFQYETMMFSRHINTEHITLNQAELTFKQGADRAIKITGVGTVIYHKGSDLGAITLTVDEDGYSGELVLMATEDNTEIYEMTANITARLEQDENATLNYNGFELNNLDAENKSTASPAVSEHDNDSTDVDDEHLSSSSSESDSDDDDVAEVPIAIPAAPVQEAKIDNAPAPARHSSPSSEVSDNRPPSSEVSDNRSPSTSNEESLPQIIKNCLNYSNKDDPAQNKTITTETPEEQQTKAANEAIYQVAGREISNIDKNIKTKEDIVQFVAKVTTQQARDLSPNTQKVIYTIAEDDKTAEVRKKEHTATAHFTKAQKEASQLVVQSVISETTARIANISLNSQPNFISNLASNITGTAAGDSHKIEKGVWISGMLAKNTQKENKNHSAYNAKIYGGTIGADAQVTEHTLIGAFYSNITSAFTFKGAAKGSKLDAKSHVFGIYGDTAFTDNLSAQMILAYGQTTIDNRRKDGTNTAISKFKNAVYSGDLNLTYNKYLANNVSIIPTMGIRYSYFADEAYKESKAGLNNLSYGKKSSSNLEAMFGAKLIWQKQVLSNLILVPSIKASVHQVLSEQSSKVKTTLAWGEEYFSSDIVKKDKKADKTRFNIGAGLLAKIDNVDLSMDYSLSIRKQYTGHQGSVKIRINF